MSHGPPSVKPHGRQTTKVCELCDKCLSRKNSPPVHMCATPAKTLKCHLCDYDPGQQQPQETSADTFLEQSYKCQLCSHASHNSTSDPMQMGSNQERTIVRVQGPSSCWPESSPGCQLWISHIQTKVKADASPETWSSYTQMLACWSASYWRCMGKLRSSRSSWPRAKTMPSEASSLPAPLLWAAPHWPLETLGKTVWDWVLGRYASFLESRLWKCGEFWLYYTLHCQETLARNCIITTYLLSVTYIPHLPPPPKILNSAPWLKRCVHLLRLATTIHSDLDH